MPPPPPPPPRYVWSLNDVCCFVPCWFGCAAATFTGLMAHECSGSKNAGVIAMMIMAIIPAHIMRSVGGGYDNESVAMTCMTSTFYFWVRSLRDDNSWPYAIVTGICYFFMVATWGGYIFVINMLGVHALLLWLIGKFDKKAWLAYTITYVIGTATSTSFLDHFSRSSQLRATPHVPYDLLYLVPMLIGC